jgi:hypothetical protein
MTKELSQICLFFVMFCLNIFSAWVNPILVFNKECFVQGYFNHQYSKLENTKGRKIQGKVIPGLF